jgi:hypothetical protein
MRRVYFRWEALHFQAVAEVVVTDRRGHQARNDLAFWQVLTFEL